MSVLTLTDAKSYLRITDGKYDRDLQDVIDGAEATIAKKCGPLSVVARTERLSGGGYGLVLRYTPVISLTSVTPVGGTAYTIGDLMVDPTSGVVEWVYGPSGFQSGRYDVTYSSGRASCPDDLLLAVKELVRHLWTPQRGPTVQASPTPGPGYLLPNRVQELMGPYVQVGN